VVGTLGGRLSFVNYGGSLNMRKLVDVWRRGEGL